MSTKYTVAIIGGAVSGAEASAQFTARGIECVVFDQNTLPYGKIEDGLPKWHAKLRDKEEGKINASMSHDLVHYVPGVRLGRDIMLEDLAASWGFSAIVLAIGAWRDRPLPLEGIDDYIGSGLIYQNPFIYWFNHKHEDGFDNSKYEIKDGAIVIGGGLASLDVMKVLMIENVQRALRARGHDMTMFKLDRSIAKVLDELGLTLEDLGIQGGTLYYRRRIKDMPLSPTPVTSPEMLEKVQGIREKVFNNYSSKYLFNVRPQTVAIDKIIEDGVLKGLTFVDTEIVDGRAVQVPGTEQHVRAPYVISSIGSVPESIPGIPIKGNMYDIIEEPCCRLKGYPNVFAVGNTVTGRGNIRESARHGREISQNIIEHYIDSRTSHDVETHDGIVPSVVPITTDQHQSLMQRVRLFQTKAGYDGDYTQWVQQNLPKRLEDIVGH